MRINPCVDGNLSIVDLTTAKNTKAATCIFVDLKMKLFPIVVESQKQHQFPFKGTHAVSKRRKNASA